MGARSVASVVISFGAASVGVKLYLSAKAENTSFNMINPKTGHRVKQLLVDEDDYDEESKSVLRKTKIVHRNSTLKGYEYAKGQYVTFTDEEVANMAAEKRDTLDLAEFVPVSEINPLHVEKTYYTNPDKGMDRQYTIMREALKQENKAAIGTWVSRGKEHLVAIRAYGDNLLVHQLFYDTEIRAHESKCKPYTPTAIDLAVSKLLIDHLSKDTLDKSKYRDNFVEQLNEAVETKLAGGEIKKSDVSISGLTNMAETIRASLLAMGVPKSQIDDMVAKAQAKAGVIQAPTPAELPKAKKTRSRKKTTKKAVSA